MNSFTRWRPLHLCAVGLEEGVCRQAGRASADGTQSEEDSGQEGGPCSEQRLQRIEPPLRDLGATGRVGMHEVAAGVGPPVEAGRLINEEDGLRRCMEFRGEVREFGTGGDPKGKT